PPFPHPCTLTWADVDPARRRLDLADLPAVVVGLVPAAQVPAPDADWRLRSVWSDAVTGALVARYGNWAVGWRWGIGESDHDGGMVSSWCCTDDSLTTPSATVLRVAAALTEWHECLVDL